MRGQGVAGLFGNCSLRFLGRRIPPCPSLDGKLRGRMQRHEMRVKGRWVAATAGYLLDSACAICPSSTRLPSQRSQKAEQRLRLLFVLNIIEDRISAVGVIQACRQAKLLQEKRLDPQVVLFGPAIKRDDRGARHMEIDLEVRHGIHRFRGKAVTTR